MNAKLAALARKLKMEESPTPAPTDCGDLACSIQQLVDQRIEQAMTQHHEQMMPVRAQRLLDRFDKPPMVTDYHELPPVARTPAPKAVDIIFQRDELGRIALVDVGSCQWRVQRNGLGQIVRMVPADIAPMPPAIEPPFLAKARQYQPGEPR
jgi:hypothetical protein